MIASCPALTQEVTNKQNIRSFAFVYAVRLAVVAASSEFSGSYVVDDDLSKEKGWEVLFAYAKYDL